MDPRIADLRRDYRVGTLDESSVAADPLAQFSSWFDQVLKANLPERTAVVLATADAHASPSARMVLLKHFDAAGFCFFTNYLSRKGRDLAENPRAALLFWWVEFERQVRISGPVQPTSVAESDAYFARRPRGSRLAACVSSQSEVVPSRAALEAELRKLEAQHPGEVVPRPAHWGGYRMVPDEYEFWQGRENRLHDRVRYRRSADAGWQIERLAP